MQNLCSHLMQYLSMKVSINEIKGHDFKMNLKKVRNKKSENKVVLFKQLVLQSYTLITVSSNQ